MPQLLDLANEILYKIIDQIHPNDIVNFSLCRKDIHELTKDAVALHVRRKKVLENVRLHGCHRHRPNSHPMWLIRDICMDWRVGEYTKCLKIQCCHNPDSVSPEGSDAEEYEEDAKLYKTEKKQDDVVVQSVMQNIQDYIEEKVVQSGIPTLSRLRRGEKHTDDTVSLTHFDVENACYHVKKGVRSTMFALLLLFLPNLEKLDLAQFTWNVGGLESMIALISPQNLQGMPGSRRPLMNLSRVCFLGAPGNIAGENFDTFMPFAALPSLRSIHGAFVEGQDITNDWNFAPHTSSITEIDLRRSAVKPECLAEMIGAIKILKRFSYNYSVEYDNGGGMEIQNIIGSLLEHAKHCLEYLAITGDWNQRIGERGSHPCKGYLRDFEVLKEVVLDSYVYVEPTQLEPTSYRDPGFIPNHTADNENNGYIVRSLVEVLPPSIETIQLVGMQLLQHVPLFLRHLLEQKALRLPKFRNLIIRISDYRPGSDWERNLRRGLGRVGVALAMYPL